MYVRRLYPEAVYSLLRKVMQLTGLKFDLKENAGSFKEQLEKETMGQPQLRDSLGNMRTRPQEKEITYIF